MVLGVISSEAHVMPPHFFEPKQKVNQEVYLEVLSNVVKPWIDTMASGRKYIFQQDSAPAHKVKT
ncbi:Transposable element tcb2 transposase, partial [Caligus rogercresseyi]